MLTVINVKLPLDYTEKYVKMSLERLLKTKIKSYKLIKRAVDARKKDNIIFICSFEVEVENENEVLKKTHNKDVFISDKDKYVPFCCKTSDDQKVFVVGSGPAGLFAAYILASSGADVTLIERGKTVSERKNDIDFFKKTGILNTASNVQFGEGGAGTFSDGKLNTGIKDKRIRYVIETFARFANGTADDILYMAKPHIGTDRLICIVENMRNEIIQLGANVLFETKLVGVNAENGVLRSIEIEDKNGIHTEKCDKLILATGHSARDTVKMLYESGLVMEQKPFAVGVRIEHKRSMIDKSQYGEFAGDPRLGAADYKIAVTPDGKRGVYSFCMCPGGEVVPASSEEGMLAVNGMSRSGRDADNSNSALLVGIAPEDLKSTNVFAGIEFQRKIERLAFELGGGGYKAPCQLAGDLIKGIKTTTFGDVIPSYLPGVTGADLRDCLPDFVIGSIRSALPEFGKQIKGFDTYDAVLTGVESRSSSPIRIKRDPETLEASFSGIYPCGEGAGYAGGIVSAAVDGIKCAEKLLMSIKE